MSADSKPPVPGSANPVTVSADALPTVQINGVVWSQVAVGNTVYVTGSFSTARPAGAAPGTSEVPRSNILAYDITTGALINSFNPGLNAVGQEITASPDGSRVYVVGEFTQAGGQTRNRVAAFNTADGSLVAGFAPKVSGPVYAVAATSSTVYLGGSFSAVASNAAAPNQTRVRLAAVSAVDGQVLPWDPLPGVGPGGSDIVLALTVTSPSQVVVGGRFGTMNGSTARGITAVDAVNGDTRPFAVNQLLLNNGVSSAVTSVSTDGVNVYASAYNFGGGGNLEGSFIAEADGGELVLVNDCRGDTYAAYQMNGVMYVASHTHACEMIGGSIEQLPRVEKRATAFTITPTTRVRPHAFDNWDGKPAGTQLAWNPGLEPGSYTGQTQAAWSITGNGSYLSYGGEFPNVNGDPQQGLVRFAMPNIAPNVEGPAFQTNQGPIVSTFAASVDISAPGVARISWPETWDIDNEYLTYRVYRDETTLPPIHTVTRPSRWFNLESMGYSDIGQSGSHRYKVTATDPFGNSTQTAWVQATIPSGSPSARAYVELVKADGATDHWPLGETSGVGYNDVGGNDLIIGGGVSRNQTGATADGNKSYGFTNSFVATERSVQAPNSVSVEAWFRTATTSGGKIVGFGDSNTVNSTVHDRSIYMDTRGRVIFGVGDNHVEHRGTIRTTGSYNNNAWHHVVGTLGPDGMALYIDGQSVGVLASGNQFAGVGPNYYGYWRIGGDTSWSGGSGYFNGWIDEVAIYEHVLSPTQIANHRLVGLGQPPINVAPTASFSQVVTDLRVGVDGSSSTDSDGTIVGYAWDFGDGTTATGVTAVHVYTEPGTYTVQLTVTDNRNATASITESVTVTSGQIDPPPGSPDYVPVVPERLLETRVSEGQVGYAGAQPVAGQTIELQVTGAGSTNVPADASAVVLNVAVTGALSDGFATVWPCGATRPTASNVNYRAGSSVANVVVSGIGTDGKVCVYTLAGADLIADINGWFPAATSYEPVVPERLLETRVSEGQVGYAGAQPVAGQTIELQVTGAGSTNVPADASAVVLNVAVTGALSDGFATVWPCGATRPTASNINYTAGSSVANVVISGIGTDGKVCVYTLAAADVIADINGWFPVAP